MAILLVILCLVGALAGTTPPTDKHTTTTQSATAPVSDQPSRTFISDPSCDAKSPYRDLSLPLAAQTSVVDIERCGDE
jgi:guanyl-specific ribonuclease Sa